jgi:hypothetical protein
VGNEGRTINMGVVVGEADTLANCMTNLKYQSFYAGHNYLQMPKWRDIGGVGLAKFVRCSAETVKWEDRYDNASQQVTDKKFMLGKEVE